ncbi:Zn-dependent alcohol dehydrogenase [Pelomyxa schiedti]|nr:Zn-dependent alcohol dehydrogenase [Pelomyxa schiedti]
MASCEGGGVVTKCAVVSTVRGPIQVERLRLQPPRAREVLVRMQAAGVCHSDWHLVTGSTKHPLPAALGHEGAGIVESVGEGVTSVKVGDAIALSWAPYCGSCFHCIRGSHFLCSTYDGPIWEGRMMDNTTRLSRNDGTPVCQFCALGCFSEFIVVPEQSCVVLPKTVPAAIRALIGCAVTTGVGAAINTAGVTPGSTVAVIGGGGVGLSVVMGAVLSGAAKVIMIDREPSKEAIARSVGATHFVQFTSHNTSDDNDELVQQVKQLTDGGEGVDFAFEAVGSPTLQHLCVSIARKGGVAVLVGLAAMGTSFPLSGATLTRHHKVVRGCYYGGVTPARDFVRVAELFLCGKLQLQKLVTRTYTLDEINQAYEDMLAGKLARGVILFDEPPNKSKL